jgi:hypothetical protein
MLDEARDRAERVLKMLGPLMTNRLLIRSI